MNRALTFTLVALAVVVALFVATWFTIPSGRFEVELTGNTFDTNRISYPARLFRTGLSTDSGFRGIQGVDLHTLRTRVVVFYGGLAVVVVLLGAAFGAFRKTQTSASPPPT